MDINRLKEFRSGESRLELDMMSPISKQIMPGSSESRQMEFKKRDSLSLRGKGYVLSQKAVIVWRLLYAKVSFEKEVTASYIIAKSSSKKEQKSGEILWIKPKLNLDKERLCRYRSDRRLLVGISKRDDSVFIDVEMFNFILGSSYKDVRSISANAPQYKEEERVRRIISGSDSINPIIVLDRKFTCNLSVDIRSVMQEEKVFETIEEEEVN